MAVARVSAQCWLPPVGCCGRAHVCWERRGGLRFFPTVARSHTLGGGSRPGQHPASHVSRRAGRKPEAGFHDGATAKRATTAEGPSSMSGPLQSASPTSSSSSPSPIDVARMQHFLRHQQHQQLLLVQQQQQQQHARAVTTTAGINNNIMEFASPTSSSSSDEKCSPGETPMSRTNQYKKVRTASDPQP